MSVVTAARLDTVRGKIRPALTLTYGTRVLMLPAVVDSSRAVTQ
jgi:hypothetical protein